MSESAHHSRAQPIRARQYLPSMAPCGNSLPDDEEKRIHIRNCKACAEWEAGKILIEQHNAQPSFHHAHPPHILTSPNGLTQYASSSTTDSVAESTTSTGSSILDSRRSSVNMDGFSIGSAYARDIANPYSDVTELSGDSESKEHRPKRTRKEMSDYEIKKAKGKNLNEQAKRLDLAVHMANLQDRPDVYCGISEGTIQATPNAKSSGLSISKDDIMTNADALLTYLLDKYMKEAIAKDCVESFKEEMNNVVKDYRVKLKNGIPVTQGTLLDDGGAPDCEGLNNKRDLKRDLRCTRHNHRDIRECKKERGKRAVAHNSALYKAQLQSRKTK